MTLTTRRIKRGIIIREELILTNQSKFRLTLIKYCYMAVEYMEGLMGLERGGTQAPPVVNVQKMSL